MKKKNGKLCFIAWRGWGIELVRDLWNGTFVQYISAFIIFYIRNTFLPDIVAVVKCSILPPFTPSPWRILFVCIMDLLLAPS